MTNIEVTVLCKLFYKYKSDKCKLTGVLKEHKSEHGNPHYHTYSPEYFRLLSPLRHKVRKMLEIGIGNKTLMQPLCGDDYVEGASIRAWREFFPHATVFGVDILANVLFESERIKTYQMDQSSPEDIHRCLTQMRADAREAFCFDVIVDDGSHRPEHMITSIRELERYLSNGGIYIIEDIRTEFFFRIKEINVPGLILICEYKGETEWDNFIAWRKAE